MDDRQIIELYFERNEGAILETERKYGRLCHTVAEHILDNVSDAEECVNDTYLALWNQIPPEHPLNLRAFISKITRNISLKRLEYNRAAKRSSHMVVSLSELDETIPDSDRFELPEESIGGLINEFLRSEKEAARNVFIRRYYFYDSISEIAAMYAYSDSKVKSMLFHTRNRLKKFLVERGVSL